MLDFGRTPSTDSVVVVRGPTGVFAARSLLQKQNGCFGGSRLISYKKMEELPEPSTSEANEFEPLSAVRCRVHIRSKHKVNFLSAFYLQYVYCLDIFGLGFHSGQVHGAFAQLAANIL